MRQAFVPLLWALVFAASSAIAVIVVIGRVYEMPLQTSGFRFERGWAWFLVLAAPLSLVAHRTMFRRRIPRLRISRVADLPKRRGRKIWIDDCLAGGRAAALLLLALALMGPQSIHARDEAEVNGIDILLTLDMSLSMQAEDINPSRFEATKQVVADFIRRRPNDRIGGVIFGRDAYTLLPLTTDKEALGNVIAELELGSINGRGTAIGNALGTALNRLRDSTAKSKVVVLLTDGDSNAGNVTPNEAAALASAMNVKVYALLMGQSDRARVRRGPGIAGAIFDVGDYPINPDLLRAIAEQTGGAFYRAADRKELFDGVHAILDSLERSEIEDPGRVYGELFPALVWPAIVLLAFEILIAALLLRRWP